MKENIHNEMFYTHYLHLDKNFPGLENVNNEMQKAIQEKNLDKILDIAKNENPSLKPLLNSTYIKPNDKNEKNFLAENDRYLVVKTEDNGYSFYYKHSQKEIENEIAKYGLSINPTDDVVHLAKKMYERDSNLILPKDVRYLNELSSLNNTVKKNPIDGVSVFRLKDGSFGVNETVAGVRSPTRKLKNEDAQSYFAGLKGQPREEVMRRREILAEKYLRNNKQEQKAVEKNEKRLPPISNETKERISNASVFKMGAGYAVRAKIDGEQYTAKKIKKEDMDTFVKMSQNALQKDVDDMKTSLAVMYYQEELETPRQELSQGMSR